MAEASLDAVEAAFGPPGRVASLIIPANCQWEPGPEPLHASPSPGLRENPGPATREAASLLREGRGGILLGGNAPSVRGLYALQALWSMARESADVTVVWRRGSAYRLAACTPTANWPKRSCARLPSAVPA